MGDWAGGRGGAASNGGRGGNGGGAWGGGDDAGRGGSDFAEGKGGGASFSVVSISMGVTVSSLEITGFESFVPIAFESFGGAGGFLSEFSTAFVFTGSAAVFASALCCTMFAGSASEGHFSGLVVLAFLASAASSFASAKLFSFLDKKLGESLVSFPSTFAAAAAAAALSFFFLLSSAPRLEFNGSRAGEILEWRLRDPDLCFLL